MRGYRKKHKNEQKAQHLIGKNQALNFQSCRNQVCMDKATSEKALLYDESSPHDINNANSKSNDVGTLFH